MLESNRGGILGMASKVPHNTNNETRDNEERLVALYEECYDRIARYVYTHIGDKSEAEDIASEVFLKALKSIKTYRNTGPPMQAWLFKIAHNLVVDHLRKVSRIKTVPIDTVEIIDNQDILAVVNRNLEMEKVGAAMIQLTEEQQEVLRLRFFGGLTSKEAGDILNKSGGAVREMQRAALEKLRQILNIEE
jgi:RNA polymerase sigma-70 factor (ECF subfamily)